MPKRRSASKFKIRQPSRELLAVFLLILGLAVSLAWVSTRFSGFYGWFSFLAVSILAALLFGLTWRVLRQERPPHWLFFLTLSAMLLRLGLGVVWFLTLPAGGYDTEVQEAGYVMEDAYNRDRAAWELAQSSQPLTEAFHGYSASDQYGGLLFLSAAIYRYLGGGHHQPLLMLTLAATVSGVAVAFIWAFARRVWGDRVAWLAAWGLAVYPEAALLGSSQMREAFGVCLISMALYSLLRFKKQKISANFYLLVVPLLLALPLSWSFFSSLVMLSALAYLALDEWRLMRKPFVLASLALFAVLALVLVFLFVDLEKIWLVQSANWQTYVSANASGWVAREFERLPLWGQVPFLVAYGIFRPLLPAALIAGGPPIWAIIGIWRALGWTVLLAMLFYATYLVFRSKVWALLPGALLLSTWIVSFTASYRGGGDLWDNPRYRSAFAGVQVALAAWAWVRHKELGDPWLRRAFVGTLLMMAWFIPWYLRRYAVFEWPIVELQQVIGLGLASTALYVLWDWVGS